MTLSRVHFGHLLLGALVLAAMLLAWRAVGVIRQPLPAIPPFKAPQLADRSLLARFDPFFPARADSGEGLPVTALPFTLHGVRADSATGRGSAIIAAGDGMQKVFSVGETIADGVTLAAIAADHVVLDRAGTREALWIDSGGEGPVQRFDPGQTPPPGASPPADGPGLTPETAPPSVMPDDEDEKVVSTAARAPAPEPQP